MTLSSKMVHCIKYNYFLSGIYLNLQRELRQLINKFFPMIELRIIYIIGEYIRNMFPCKDKLPLECRSSNACHNCGSCNVYIGKTVNTSFECSMVPKNTYIPVH